MTSEPRQHTKIGLQVVIVSLTFIFNGLKMGKVFNPILDPEVP